MHKSGQGWVMFEACNQVSFYASDHLASGLSSDIKLKKS